MRAKLTAHPTAMLVESESCGCPGGGALIAILRPLDGSTWPIPNRTCQPWTMSVSSSVSGGLPTIADGGPGILAGTNAGES